VLGAANTLWADDADLELSCRGRRAFRQCHRSPVDEFGGRSRPPLGGIAQCRSPNLFKRRRMPG
jgi:hypothetical protein